MAPRCMLLSCIPCPNSCSPNVSALHMCLFLSNFRQQGQPPICSWELHLPTTARGSPRAAKASRQKSPRRAGPENRRWPGAHITATKHHPDLGRCSGTGWPRATTISFPGPSPTSHSLAWDFRLLGAILDPMCLCQHQGQAVLTLEFLRRVRHRCAGQPCDLGR